MKSKIAPGVVKLAAPPDAPTAGQQSPGHRSMGPTASPRAIMTGKGP
jgi:hypothetical protein